MKRFGSLFLIFLALLIGGYGIFYLPVSAQQQFKQTTRNDVVVRLQQQLERGEVKLEYSDTSGYLQSVLKYLGTPISSQSLVFSRTSLQTGHISPTNPRAIFFNDEVYVGWIRGAELIEITAIDPKLGAELYVLEQKKSDQPRFARGTGCTGCHISANTRYVAGHLLRSVSPDVSGNSYITDHTSPLLQRWGGWYVTGTHGSERHLGNMISDAANNLDSPENMVGGNLTSLDKKFDLSGYASPHSDIVALMVLAHQTQGQNLIVWLGQEARMAQREQEELAQTAQKATDEWQHSPKHKLQYAADEVLKYLLFTEEAQFNSPIKGTSEFAREFAAKGIRDKQARSLRDFDLQHRLFRYPCSYLIYTEAFDNIPQPALDYLYRRLWLILTGQDNDKAFASLKADDRKAILEILCATKKNLPEYFYNSLETHQ